MLKKLDTRILLLIGIIVLILLLMQKCDQVKDLKTDLTWSKSNAKALIDTITTTKNKAGQLQYEKDVLLSSQAGIRELNSRLYQEIKKTQGQVAYIAELVAGIEIPKPPAGPGTGSVTGDPCDSLGGTFTVEWEAKQDFDSLNSRHLKTKTMIDVKKGKIVNNLTEISKDEIRFNLITGLVEKNGNFEIFVRSDFPGFKPTKIDGAFIPREKLFPQQKKKNFSIGVGPQIGLGMGGVSTLRPAFYIGVGASFQYTIFRF
jgi:hypothetical protein